MRLPRLAAPLAALCSFAVAPPLLADALAGRELFVQRDGLRLSLWEKCLPGGAGRAAREGKVALLVHGATWSGRPDFDLQIRDYSLMDFLARHGYDVFAIDIHGYGRSEKTERDWSSTASAALDVGAALAEISKLRGVPKIRVFGWSWGTMITGLLAMEQPEHIARLILFGPVWKGSGQTGPPPKEQYRVNSEAAAREDFDGRDAEPEVVALYAREALAADPRSPNGVRLDVQKLPLVDPARIKVPTLILRGDQDPVSTETEMLEFFGKLGTTDKSYLSLPNAGHAALLERGHLKFQHAVLAFFDAP
jgi:pimeloyl-ACP methyl ester carboxylesterase